VNRFSIQESVAFGWQITKRNLALLVGIILLVMMAQAIPAWFSRQTVNIPVLPVLFDLAAVAVQILVGIGLLKILLNFHDAKPVEIADLFKHLPLFWRYLFGSILYALIVFGGTLLFVVPGVIWALKYEFYGYLIVDKGLGPVEALKESGRLTQGVKWQLFGLGLVLMAIQLIGFICFVVGLLVTIPIGMLAVTRVYRVLAGHIQTEPPAQS